MTKERLTIEIDADLMARLKNAGVDPIQYAERILAQSLTANETQSERAGREQRLRAEMQAGVDAHDRLFEEAGDWSADLRAF
ncbi:MAG TPA: type II toxin-antitoxin system CcdA family antitoxin [Caulobacterales bacterium]|nr:type II toxin-antitoxin system CcdA family antitoxin [Caulobacterales bacterium]